MTTSELLTPWHLSRKALIYIRQSSPHQVLSNQESLRLQYALKQRAEGLGFPEQQIEIIDVDLGTTGASAEHRKGFKELIAQVTLGEVGIILSYDVTRLSRNCSDWYPLLDLCGYKNCLIGDRDGVYDPSSPNGRLLLGLKGQISEMELYTIRARLTAGLLCKAERGELALTLPVGLIRDELGNVEKEANQEVQERIQLVFTLFLQTQAASQVLQRFNQEELLLPRRTQWGDIIWRKPTIAAILGILKNPAYAGSFVYGRTKTVPSPSQPGKQQQQRLPMQEWKIRVNDKYPAYIDWPTYEKIQAKLMDNYAEYDRKKTRGIPRSGAAVLHGLVYCGECGHKMLVQYKGSPRYICNYLRQQYRVPVCQFIPTSPVDNFVIEAFLAAISPIELDALALTLQARQQQDESLERARQQQLERLRYQATLAERRFSQVDPDNRLVAAELEKRWEMALQELRQAMAAQRQPPVAPASFHLSPEMKEAFQHVGQHLPQLWQGEDLTRPQKKALLRCLIDKVVVHRSQRDYLQTRIIWKGGDTTTADLPIPVGSLRELTNGDELEARILEMSQQGLEDEAIAEQLTQEGFRSPLRPTLLPSTVKTIRLRQGIFRVSGQSHPRRIPGYLTVSQIALALNLSPHWIYDRIHNGIIAVERDESTKLYLFPDGPETLSQFEQLKAGQFQNLRFL